MLLPKFDTSVANSKQSIPVRPSPANLGIRAGCAIDLRLAVDSEVAVLVQLQKLILNGACLPVKAFHLTPGQHVQLACRHNKLFLCIQNMCIQNKHDEVYIHFQIHSLMHVSAKTAMAAKTKPHFV